MTYSCKRILNFIALLLASLLRLEAADDNMLFTSIFNPGGDRHVRGIMQLPDGRMVFSTFNGIEIYDGNSFTHIPHPEASRSFPLPYYLGHNHLYLTGNRYLWIKDRQNMKCLDLDTETYVADKEGLLKRHGAESGRAGDIFGDALGRLWLITDNAIVNHDSGIRIPYDRKDGSIIDLMADDKYLTLFFNNGITEVYSIPEGRRLSVVPLPDNLRQYKDSPTMMTVATPDGLYQIRNLNGGALLRFNPADCEWSKIMDSGLYLNTLAIDWPDAYITTNHGFIYLDLLDGGTRHLPFINSSSGNILSTEISTIAIDREKGLWLGTLDRGIFHYHPLLFQLHSIPKRNPDKTSGSISSIFFENSDGSVSISDNGVNLLVGLSEKGSPSIKEDRERIAKDHVEFGNNKAFVTSNGSVCVNESDRYDIFINGNMVSDSLNIAPLFSKLYVNGELIIPGKEYNGNRILEKTLSRTDRIVLRPEQNHITVEVAVPFYSASPRDIYVKLENRDSEWLSTKPERTEKRGVRILLSDLRPGDYILRVRLSDAPDAPEAALALKVMHPWWDTPLAYCIYILAAIALVVAGMKLYASIIKKRIAREQREKYLLKRIKNLIEEVDRYKNESAENDSPFLPSSPQSAGSPSDEKDLSDSDKAFIAKAIESVEKNLNTQGYSVEQLSRDLCMDRTGLYRKLTAMLDRSPSIFIRDIRLRNAARLIKEGNLSITEISELTGFSSSSYMSKCFQERYGCRPSEYKD